MRLHVAWGSIIRFIKSIFFKKSMIDRANHFVMSSFVKWLYMSCHKVHVKQSPVSHNRFDRTVLLLVHVTSGICRSWYSGVVVWYLCWLTFQCLECSSTVQRCHINYLIFVNHFSFCISFMCLSVFAVFLMLFAFCCSLWLTCISLSPFLKIVLLSSKSHSMLTSSGYFLASLNMDLKWLCYFFSWYDSTSLICWSFELLI